MEKKNNNSAETSAVSSAPAQELICIRCPRGCMLTVTGSGGHVTVSGNFCKKGEEYGRQEIVSPTRVLTVLMRPEGSSRPISVKTDRPVPKELLFTCADAIYKVHPKLPVKYGDVLIENLLGTGCNVIATCDID